MTRRTDGTDDLSKRTLAEAEKAMTDQSTAARQRGTSAWLGGGGAGSYVTGAIGGGPIDGGYRSGITEKDGRASDDRPKLPPAKGDGGASAQVDKGTSLPKKA